MHSRKAPGNMRPVGGMKTSLRHTALPMMSPLNTALTPIGRTSSQWSYKPTFDGAMSQFGQPLSRRNLGVVMPGVSHTASAGMQYHAALKNGYEYIKNPRSADGMRMNDDGIGSNNNVEKRF